jgi:hypothetical protein
MAPRDPLHPFEVSQAIRHIINATVDQLHGVKVAVHDAQQQHLAVSAPLSRTALENTATGMWILGPHNRNVRIERVLRWHSRKYNDFQMFLAAANRDTGAEQARNNAALHRIRSVAQTRGIDPNRAASGFRVTAPLTGCAEFTDLPVYSDWQIASGFAHGRPWTHHGFLHREQISAAGNKHAVYRLTAREDMTVYLPLQAIHLLSQLLRLRDCRTGMQMPSVAKGNAPLALRGNGPTNCLS